MAQQHPQATPIARSSSRSSFIPFRSKSLEESLVSIEARGLSRTHKHIFFLIDGQRSIQELARLFKRDGQGVYSLLHDLERIELITFTRANSSA